MTMDLITRERALRNLAGLTSPTAAELLVLDTLIKATSAAIERHCRRSFALAARDETYDGSASPALFLREYPVLSVERVAHGLTPVLRIRNDSGAVQRASVKVTDDDLTLTRVESSVTTVSNLAFADNPTLSALAIAVTAIGSGWSGVVTEATYAAWASADLRALQGAFACRTAPAELSVHVDELAGFDIVAAQGILLREDGFAWRGGRNAWRVVYTAGFDAVPDDVQEACAQWTAALFWQTKRDPGLTRETLAGAVTRVPSERVPPSVGILLEDYRKYPIL